MEIRVYPEFDVPEQLRMQLAALREREWPGAGGDAHDPLLRPVTVLLVTPRATGRDAYEVVAALDILSKDITHAGHTYRAAGLSAVVTATAHRGKGNGRQLVAAARELIAGSGSLPSVPRADLALFTCDRPLRRFYESAGWQCLDGTVLIGGTPHDPFPSDQPGFDKVTMAGFFTERAMRHADTFPHSRIALHPGEIDKLW
ncbi:GNAT family N-acetyltransferase [Streptomyces triculaminicus]|uniref:GNAT family N-acetyltransferase n=2 Tax=Streptomyces TaxID=1883 RepID=A0A939FKB3_9ACTN|nr:MULTISPECIES: GNAT family N-acetyltransferase [Streptomyces]MBO0652847.1 GNAT family N-acetyltransferase [Streptomyces triculaminicus]QSY51613.1 GNAT family N-acetyltransferase [Streptomyces griseocarneus]